MDKHQNKFGNWVQTSITARMLMIGILIIVLLIPLSYIESLITERSNRQESVVNEINDKTSIRHHRFIKQPNVKY